MKIIIHRGQNQIGGSIIEIATESTRIVLDAGINLDEETDLDIPKINGLFEGDKGYDALLISHYHADHVGLADWVIKGIPIYMGENAYNMLVASNEYRRIETSFKPEFIKDKIQLQIGDINITPFRCDHSAYDSYMFLIKADGRHILYTGDFRANGRMDHSSLLYDLPQVDALIIEGTTLSREESVENIKEMLLEDIATVALRRHTGPCFVFMSAMNIDRLITMYNVAQNTGRVFLEDIYTAIIGEAAGVCIPDPKRDPGVRVFVTDGNKDRYDKLNRFGNSKISRAAIARQKYVMCVRPSMIRYLEKLNEIQSFEDGILFYGMWKGYQEKDEVKNLLKFMEDKGVKLHILHTSGHADSSTIDRLIKDVNPKVIIPVHTENSEWFDRYEDEIEVIYDRHIVEL